MSDEGRIKVVSRGISLQARDFAIAETLAAFGGPGTEILYVPPGSEDGWRVWTEGKEWPDEDDFRYHLFALEVKRLRRERAATNLQETP